MISTERKKGILSFIQEAIFAPLLFLSCFVIMALMMFFDVLQVDAATFGGGTMGYDNHFVWQTYANAGSYYYDYDVKITSVYPIYGYYQGDNQQTIQLRMVDAENKQWYHMSIENSATNNLFMIVSATMDSTSKEDPDKSSRKIDASNTVLTNGLLGCVTPKKAEQGYYGTITCALFDCEDSFLNFVETGSLDGLVKEDENNPERDFGEEYDASVPVPELTNITHAGFNVSNAAEDLELDLVVKSEFYELAHGDASGIFVKNANYTTTLNSFNSHYYDCTLRADVGYYKSSYNLQSDFNCSNYSDLLADGKKYFSLYPTHTSLPDYSYLKHNATSWQAEYDLMKSAYEIGSATDMVSANPLAQSKQAVTIYYVRFIKLKIVEGQTGAQLVPGQWYCYQLANNGGGKDSVIISPVEGGGSGGDEPILTDPIGGIQDPENGIVINDPTYNINTNNPMEMISGFLDFIVQLPQLLGGLSAFLADAFVFIPKTFWDIIFAGIGFSVLFLVFRAIK